MMSKKKLINRFVFIYLLQINGFAIANNTVDIDTEALYTSALSQYEKKHYEEAITNLKVAVEKEPEIAKYHHILAVSYGKEAAQANWFKAMDYAKKTLIHLEKANELEPNNLEILDDLMDYYHEAPRFLGGDKKKGDEIQALIKKLTLESEKTTKK